MKVALLAGTLVGSVLASSHGRHLGFHNKRGELAPTGTSENGTCGAYTTYTTYYYGEPTLVQETPSSSTSCTTSSTEVSSSTEAPYVPTSTETPVVYATPSSSTVEAAVYAAAATSSVPSYSSGGKISSNGNMWAMTYTPYTNSGGCKSANEVMADLKKIAAKGFKAVRTYSTDCSGLQNIGAAAEATGLEIILGVYISGSGVSGAQSQVNDIIKWGKWNLVQLIVVGNEAVWNKFCTAGQLAGFIASSKAAFKAAGYTGAVTTTEPVNTLQEIGSQLCGVLDVMGANIHAYFNSGTSAANAGEFVAGQLDILAGICPGLPTYNLESGWPTSGATNGAAVPGVYQQKQAIGSIIAKVGYKSVIFSFDNDPWKHPGSYGVEQYFGCLSNL